MKRILTLLTAVLLSVLILPFAAFATDGSLAHFSTGKEALTFADVSSGDWFAPYVQGVSKAGLMIGVGGDRFAPEADITLAEVYTVTARIHAIYHTGSAEAADGYDNREDKPWFYGYVKYCMDCGIMPGEPGDVTQPAFRIECATLLSRALPEAELLPINEVADDAIPDLPSSRNTENVYRLYRAGVLTGMDDKGTFRPESKVRRCEVAAIVSRLIDPALRRTVSGLETAKAGGSITLAKEKHPELDFTYHDSYMNYAICDFAFTPSGNLLLLQLSDSVAEYTPGGELVGVYSYPFAEEGQTAYMLAADSMGNFYFADGRNNLILKANREKLLGYSHMGEDVPELTLSSQMSAVRENVVCLDTLDAVFEIITAEIDVSSADARLLSMERKTLFGSVETSVRRIPKDGRDWSPEAEFRIKWGDGVSETVHVRSNHKGE
ncbi:MAG: S-layer homology domain-containing protein, partial [Clostridia bacterium]|nr:S-layer homology domain-containing protein [Clostridia bacterium]